MKTALLQPRVYELTCRDCGGSVLHPQTHSHLWYDDATNQQAATCEDCGAICRVPRALRAIKEDK